MNKSNNKMKTIQVVFTKSLEADIDNTKHLTRYTFNVLNFGSEDNIVELEDLLTTVQYPGKYLMVVAILEGEPYTHYSKTGDLAREKVDENYHEIRKLDYTDPEELERLSKIVKFTIVERS